MPTGSPGNAREMQETRDGLLAFQTHGADWVSRSQSAWRKALAASTAEGPSSNSLSHLELIGDEVVETSILSSRLAQSIQDKANFELNDLRLRIQHLEGTHELSAKDILKPEALARVLVDQWLATGLNRGLWNKVQDQVQQHMVEGVVQAYKDANAFLVGKDVMPEIDLKSFVRRTGSVSSGTAPLGGSFAGSHGGSASMGISGQLQAGGFGAPVGSFAPAAIGVGRGAGGPGQAGGDTQATKTELSSASLNTGNNPDSRRWPDCGPAITNPTIKPSNTAKRMPCGSRVHMPGRGNTNLSVFAEASSRTMCARQRRSASGSPLPAATLSLPSVIGRLGSLLSRSTRRAPAVCPCPGPTG